MDIEQFDGAPAPLSAHHRTVDLLHRIRIFTSIAYRRRPGAPRSCGAPAGLDLFRGPFMDGFDFAGLPAWETWHLAQQELWRQRQERLFAQVIDDLCAVERYGEL
ncbi:MAG: hypothetical protein R2838_15980 [Caldilineaceae bacterium]